MGREIWGFFPPLALKLVPRSRQTVSEQNKASCSGSVTRAQQFCQPLGTCTVLPSPTASRSLMAHIPPQHIQPSPQGEVSSTCTGSGLECKAGERKPWEMSVMSHVSQQGCGGDRKQALVSLALCKRQLVSPAEHCKAGSAGLAEMASRSHGISCFKMISLYLLYFLFLELSRAFIYLCISRAPSP